MAAAVYWFGLVEGVPAHYKIENQTVFGVFLLLGLPIFYLLTFAGQEEETEIEVAAMCATLGLGLTGLALAACAASVEPDGERLHGHSPPSGHRSSDGWVGRWTTWGGSRSPG